MISEKLAADYRTAPAGSQGSLPASWGGWALWQRFLFEALNPIVLCDLDVPEWWYG